MDGNDNIDDNDAELDDLIKDIIDEVPTNLPKTNKTGKTNDSNRTEDDALDSFDKIFDDDVGIDDEVVVQKTKTRAPRAKLNDQRLMEPNGLSFINKNFKKKIRLKGKGHELGDADRILDAYRLWAHEVFPKANFRDFMAIARKQGHTKLLKVYRRSMIHEFRSKASSLDYEFGEEIGYNENEKSIVDSLKNDTVKDKNIRNNEVSLNQSSRDDFDKLFLNDSDDENTEISKTNENNITKENSTKNDKSNDDTEKMFDMDNDTLKNEINFIGRNGEKNDDIVLDEEFPDLNEANDPSLYQK